MNLYDANRQYANRPADERFGSLDDLIRHATHEKNLSAERLYNFKELRAVAVPNASTGLDGIQLASPKGAAALSHWAFGQLCRTIGAPAAYLREGISAGVAVQCVNEGINALPAGTTGNLLVRAANGGAPVIRAATSDSYGRVWDADLYGGIADTLVSRDARWQLPMTWEGTRQGAYRGDRDSFLIITNGGSIVDDPSARSAPGGGGNAGAMYRGLLVRNSEVGASSVVIDQILFRYICGNHILWGAVRDQRFRRRHVGKSALRETLREIGKIAFNWAGASTDRDNAIIRLLTTSEIATTREGVIDELRAMGATEDQAEAAIDKCVETEAVSPWTYWGIAQGLTRNSQAAPYQDERFKLDQLAGLILARGAKKVAA